MIKKIIHRDGVSYSEEWPSVQRFVLASVCAVLSGAIILFLAFNVHALFFLLIFPPGFVPIIVFVSITGEFPKHRLCTDIMYDPYEKYLEEEFYKIGFRK